MNNDHYEHEQELRKTFYPDTSIIPLPRQLTKKEMEVICNMAIYSNKAPSPSFERTSGLISRFSSTYGFIFILGSMFGSSLLYGGIALMKNPNVRITSSSKNSATVEVIGARSIDKYVKGKNHVILEITHD